MAFQIIRNDITKVYADAIVNTANPNPVYASGTDLAIYQAAGADALLAERREIGTMQPGEVSVTGAYGLHAKYIIHTVGPAWNGGDHGEFETLAACYRKSLHLAEKLGCESIAFPLISTGVYGFPKDQALQIALRVIREFLKSSEMEVTLVVFNRSAYELSEKLTSSVRQYIDDHYVAQAHKEEYRGYGYRPSEASPYEDAEESASPAIPRERQARGALPRPSASPMEKQSSAAPPKPSSSSMEKQSSAAPPRPSASSIEEPWEETLSSPSFPREESIFGAESSGYTPQSPAASGKAEKKKKRSVGISWDSVFGKKPEKPKAGKGRSLEDLLGQAGESFQHMVLRMMDERDMDAPQLYKRANLDKKLFSKIKTNPDYTPKKTTAVALAIALQLNLDETKDLLGRAGLALSPSNTFDLIIQFCIDENMYDVFEINALLFQYDQPLLGV